MIRLAMKICNMILTENQQKFSIKTDKYEYPTSKEAIPLSRSQIIEQNKFTYSLLGKALEKQTEKQVDALPSLNLSDKTDELKQIERIFPNNLLTNVINDRAKKKLNNKIVSN